MREAAVNKTAEAAEAAETSSRPEIKSVYRLEGLSCANCAGKFESNVRRLPGVRDAKVNFGAAKLTVYGSATLAELEQAGAFENIKVILPDSRAHPAGRGQEPLRDSASRESAPREDAPGDPALRDSAFPNPASREKDPPARQAKPAAFFRRYAALLAAALLLASGYASLFINGEEKLVTTLLFAASIFIGGRTLLKAGLKNLLRLDFDMRTLMTVAIVGAAIIGEWAEGAVVVILFAISEALERHVMDRARQSIRTLMELAPRQALVRRGGEERVIDVRDIAVGDIIIVKPGQKIAMDGVVIGGRSAVNQSAITGESVPVEKKAGDEVFAGTLNGDGLLEVKVAKRAENTAIARIIHLVEEAQAERAPAQAFVDRFAKIYTPLIMAVAAAVAVFPPLLAGADWGTWVYQGLAVLVVGCPCALVISTPVSIVSAIGNAAGKGVLIKGGIYLEQLGKIKAVAFDKTGTLTMGAPSVTDFRVFNPNHGERNILAAVAALERRSGHPLAAAVVRKAGDEGIDIGGIAVDDFVSLTGRGVRGTVNGTTYIIGSPRLIAELSGIRISGEAERYIRSLQEQGKTAIVVGANDSVAAVMAVADELRASAKTIAGKLARLGIGKTVMLTGDNRHTAAAIAAQAGLSEAQAELMPEDKLEAIRKLRDECGSVAMVGDGVNDAPALAAATVGIAMGGAGTDTALETADMALMGDDLGKLAFAVKLSRKTLSVIKQNIAFALAVKLFALLLVVPGWLTLWIAILSDMGATLLVALNGMRLMRVKE